MTNDPTLSFSSTVGLYELQSVNLGELLLMSFTSNITTERLARLVVPPQHRPLSVAVTFNEYDTRDLSSNDDDEQEEQEQDWSKDWSKDWSSGRRNDLLCS